MKNKIVSLLIISVLLLSFIPVATMAEAKSTAEEIAAEMPVDMIVDEEQWNHWTPAGACKLFPFMLAASQAGFSFSVPWNQENTREKRVEFVFEKEDGSQSKLEKAEMYYMVEDQTILYTGLTTSDKEIFESDDFRNACICLMLAYNIHFDAEQGTAVPNLARERAKEIVEYSLGCVDQCLVEGMRIRIMRNDEKPCYSFHMEF